MADIVERDDLARAALTARTELAEKLQMVRHDQEILAGRVTQLETDMTTLKGKLAEAKGRMKEIHNRGRTRSPGPSREDPISRNERKIRHAMGRFDRLQRQVERLEARVRSYEVGAVAPSPWDAAGAEPDPSIEAELKALKARVSPKAAEKTTEKESEQA